MRKTTIILVLMIILSFGLFACGGGGGGGSESGAAGGRPVLEVIVDARVNAHKGGEIPFATGAQIHLQMQMEGKTTIRDAVVGNKLVLFKFYEGDLVGTSAVITVTVNYRGKVKTQVKTVHRPEHSVYFSFAF